MELEQAITILETYNKWRRDRTLPSGIAMGDPVELGKAIDKVVSEFKESEVSEILEIPQCDGTLSALDNLTIRK